MSKLNHDQQKVLREVKAAPSYKRASPKVRKALLEAVAVESNFSTPDQAHSDRDSEGALQQRPSQGWGPTSESNTTDAEQFLRRAIPLAKKYGSAGALAQAVQRSAYPDRYNQASGRVSGLLGDSSSSSGTRSSGGARAHSAAITVDIPTAEDKESFDEAGFEKAKKLSILGAYLKKKNPNNSLLRAGVLSDTAPDPSDFTKTETTVGTEKFTIPGTGSSSSTGGGTDGSFTAAAERRADQLDSKRFPYKWGGGHGTRLTAGTLTPVDCSGAVSYVTGVDPRVSGQFETWGRPGDGGDKGVTVYANSHHVLMKINGRFFGTSSSNPGGGAGWIDASHITKDYLKGFTVRHSERA